MNDVLDVIHVFADNLPALLCGELAELNELVLCVLFVGADAGIDGDFHGFAFRGRPVPKLPVTQVDSIGQRNTSSKAMCSSFKG